LAAYNRISTHPTWAESLGRIREFLQTLIATEGNVNLAVTRQNNPDPYADDSRQRC
jgi:hypothetical protein